MPEPTVDDIIKLANPIDHDCEQCGAKAGSPQCNRKGRGNIDPFCNVRRRAAWTAAYEAFKADHAD